jgi:hypothetical protein
VESGRHAAAAAAAALRLRLRLRGSHCLLAGGTLTLARLRAVDDGNGRVVGCAPPLAGEAHHGRGV